MFLPFVFLLFVSLFSHVALANCDFKTALHIDELKNPRFLHSIEIEIAKSRQYFRNIIETTIAQPPLIPKKYKKKFKAEIIARYPFGSCSFRGSVRQNGDYVDHVRIYPRPERSLVVKLNEGNILGATKFKLFLPETRNDVHEVIGALILQELGFISPETAIVPTKINGVVSKMIFQEDARKEMLERNFRREGPIFEGDEELRWNDLDIAYDEVSLSRLINKNWFEKGSVSQEITIGAHSALQHAYLDYTQNWPQDKRTIYPNNGKHRNFQDYAFILSAMNGYHALANNNRRYYYNSIDSRFEPIYYDGNLNVLEPIDLEILHDMTQGAFPEGYLFTAKDKLIDENWKKKICSKFKARVDLAPELAGDFCTRAFQRLRTNVAIAEGAINDVGFIQSMNEYIENKNNLQKNLLSFEQKKQAFGLRQKQIIASQIKDEGIFVKFSDGENEVVAISDFATAISRQVINNDRVIHLPENISPLIHNLVELKLNGTPGFLIHTPSLVLKIDYENLSIDAEQTTKDDWLLLNGVDLNGWSITFKGVEAIENDKKQRFNKHGLTGCLTVFQSRIKLRSLVSSRGGCEDVINLISSIVEIDYVNIFSAPFDALDADFSTFSVERIVVNESGNDCIDFSQSEVHIGDGQLRRCGDKAVSVGEVSSVNIDAVKINEAAVGFAVKDLSNIYVHDAIIKNANVCVTANQKKQEFGGGLAKLRSVQCAGRYVADDNSIIEFLEQ